MFADYFLFEPQENRPLKADFYYKLLKLCLQMEHFSHTQSTGLAERSERAKDTCVEVLVEFREKASSLGFFSKHHPLDEQAIENINFMDAIVKRYASFRAIRVAQLPTIVGACSPLQSSPNACVLRVLAQSERDERRLLQWLRAQKPHGSRSQRS